MSNGRVMPKTYEKTDNYLIFTTLVLISKYSWKTGQKTSYTKRLNPEMKQFYITLFLVLASAIAFSQTTGDYRSKGNNGTTVDFNTATNWQVYTVGGTWINAINAPASTGANLKNNNTITILSNHNLKFNSNVSFASNTNFTIVLQGGLTGSSVSATYGTGQPLFRIEKASNFNASNLLQNQTIKNLELVGTSGTPSFTFTNGLKITNTLTVSNANLVVDFFSINNGSLTVTSNGNITINNDQSFSNSNITFNISGNSKSLLFKSTLSLTGTPGSNLTANFSGTSGLLDLARNVQLTNSTFNVNFPDANSTSNAGELNVDEELTLSSSSSINVSGAYATMVKNGNNLQITNSSINLLSNNQTMEVNGNSKISLSSNGYIKLQGSNSILNLSEGVGFDNYGNTGYVQLSATSMVQKQVKNNDTYTFPIGNANYYLPATLKALPGGGNATFSVGVFQGATNNAMPNGQAISKAPIVDAVWTVNSSINKNVNLNFGWQSALEGAVFTTLSNSQIGIASTTQGNVWSKTVNGNANKNSQKFAANSIQLSSTGTNAFAIAQINTILPVVSRNFTAVNLNEQVKLSWAATATSLNSVFEVERSAEMNGKFEKIASIYAKQTGEANYDFADQHPLKGESYYRVKIIDENGNINYTKTIRITLNASQLSIDNLYPTAGNGMVNLLISSSRNTQIQLTVVDLSGRTASAQTISVSTGSRTYSLDMTKLAAGQYFLIMNNNQQVKTSRFIKQ